MKSTTYYPLHFIRKFIPYEDNVAKNSEYPILWFEKSFKNQLHALNKNENCSVYC